MDVWSSEYLGVNSSKKNSSRIGRPLGALGIAGGLVAIVAFPVLAKAHIDQQASSFTERQTNPKAERDLARLVARDGFTSISFSSSYLNEGILDGSIDTRNEGVPGGTADHNGIRTNAYGDFSINFTGCSLPDVTVGAVRTSASSVTEIDHNYYITSYGTADYTELETYHFDSMQQLKTELLGNDPCATILRTHLQTEDPYNPS